ncbi:MAG: TonB C-terminal domain-containing protein [Desulfobulbaceae bacterium]|nr:TonB C-terminal domain-containing protein [Desulfobulbaceae bacterium]
MSPFADAPCEQGRFVTIEGYTGEHRRKPLVLALIVHFLVVIIMLLPASIFDFHRNREEIYTVNLFEALESPPAKEMTKPPAEIKKKEEIPPPPPPEVKKIEAPPVKPPVAAEKIEPVISTETESSAPAEIVSLKPRLVKKDLKPKKVDKKEDIKVDQALNRIKNELNRKQAEKKAREMQAAAAVAVDDAVAKLRDSIHTQRLLTSTSTSAQLSTKSSAGGGSGTSDAKLDAALKLYYVAVSQKIHEHWVLPEMQEWKKDLKAVVVVEVRRDGVVTKYEFEQKSGNHFFDQFVEKTLKESLPLPPFPADLEESNLEIGLVFHPSGLQ